uniref:Uncharacterized protein n=1 Tax=Romanomermis culicivorax TaxID=13658 RepID=A0A915IV44_ROMCU
MEVCVRHRSVSPSTVLTESARAAAAAATTASNSNIIPTSISATLQASQVQPSDYAAAAAASLMPTNASYITYQPLVLPHPYVSLVDPQFLVGPTNWPGRILNWPVAAAAAAAAARNNPLTTIYQQPHAQTQQHQSLAAGVQEAATAANFLIAQQQQQQNAAAAKQRSFQNGAIAPYMNNINNLYQSKRVVQMLTAQKSGDVSGSILNKTLGSSLLTDRIIYAAAAQEANSLVKAVNATAAATAANTSNVAENQNSLVTVSDSEPPSPAVSFFSDQIAILNPKTYMSHQQNNPSNISKLVNTTGMIIANDNKMNLYHASGADFANVKSENVPDNNYIKKTTTTTSSGYGNATATRRAQQYAVVRPIQIKRELAEDDESTNNSGLDLSIASSVSDVGDFALHYNAGTGFLPPHFADAVSVVEGAYNNVNLAGLATNFRSLY